MAAKKSRLSTVPLESDEVGRPRKNSLDEDTVLSFRVTAELRDALDEGVKKVNAATPGRSMSRTELVKIVLYDWFKRGSKLPK